MSPRPIDPEFIGALLRWFEQERSNLEKDQKHFERIYQEPGAAADPEVSRIGGEIDGRTRILSSFLDLLGMVSVIPPKE